MKTERSNFHVLLVSPPTRRIRFNTSGVFPMQPLGLAFLAAYLREREISVSILDAVNQRLNIKETIDIILSKRPDIASFSTTIFNIADTHAIIAEIKRQAPEIITVLGGYGVVFPPEKLGDKLKEVDFFVKGEGEEALFRLVLALRDKGDLKEVPGIIWRADGHIRFNSPCKLLNVNELPLPALDLLPKTRYSMHPPFNIKPPLCLVETARGCGWHCNFCSLSPKLRQKSAERVIEEIAWAKKIFGANEIHFVDPTFTAGRKRLIEVIRAIKKEFPGLAWTCKSRVELIDDDIARELADAGCYMVSLGVESGSQKMLDSMNKETKVEEIYTALRAMKKANIRALAYIMFGAPGETDETVKETMTLLKNLKPDYALFAGLMPDPLSEILNIKSKEGWFTADDVFNLYYNGSPKNTPFERNSFTGIPIKTLDRWVKKAYIDYYLKPGYFARRLFGIRSVREIMNLAVGASLLARDTFSISGIGDNEIHSTDIIK